MNVTKLKIVCADPAVMPGFALIAYLYPGETEWRDPHGGTFTAEEQVQFHGVATGFISDVMLHGNTRFERVIPVRFVAEF